MSEKNKIEFIYELKLRWSDLALLSDDQKATLAILSFAANEMNVLLKVYINTLHAKHGEEFIDTLAFSQGSVILRTISSKLFEIKETLEFGGNKKKTSDKEILQLATKALSKFDQIEPKDGYDVSRDVRNEVANHYPFGAAKKNLAYVSEKADASLYMHKMVGNSYYPLGDEVMFVGRLNRHGKLLNTDEDRLNLQSVWFEWVKGGVKWLNRTNSAFQVALLRPLSQERVARRKMYYLTSEMSSGCKSKTPLFLKVSEALATP